VRYNKTLTPKQIERVYNKIKKVKAALVADKKHWGGFYHDGQGLRYLQPQLYIQIDDFSGALRYFNWFDKNFPDDGCYPAFLYEWTIVLFKTGRLKAAEQKAFQLCGRYKDVFYNIAGINTSSTAPAKIEDSYILTLKSKESLSDFNLWFETLPAKDAFKDTRSKGM